MRALHTGAAQLFALSNDQPNRDTNEQIDLSSPSGQTSTKLHPSAAHNSFLKRIAGKNHSINSGLRHREPRLTTNETAGLSPSPTKQVVEARGVKVLEKEKQRIRKGYVVKSQDCSHGNESLPVELSEISCSSAGGCRYMKSCFAIGSTFLTVLSILDLEIIILFLLCASFPSACNHFLLLLPDHIHQDPQ